jgi:YfiH family protein
MILPPGPSGVAFTEAADGDQKGDIAARQAVSERLGIQPEWATVTQVHGDAVRYTAAPGNAGEADGLWTDKPALPIAVLTADCYGVVLFADTAVGVAHAGWRGARSGVVTRVSDEMADAGHQPKQAYIGPGIGSCCFEVGPEVAEIFPGMVGVTDWGTTSVDLEAVIEDQLSRVEHSSIGVCTRHEPGWFSHRRDGTGSRMATIGWLP